MPQAFAQWVVTYFGVTGVAGSVVYAAAYVVAVVAISAGLTAISREMSNTPKGLRGYTQEYAGTVASTRLIFGTVRVSGLNVIPAIVSSTTGEYLHQVLALAGHEIDDITSVWFNQEEVDDADIDAITYTTSDGLVTAGTFADMIWVRRYTGNQTQADAILLDQVTEWTSSHIGYGIPYLALQYKYNAETFGRTGKPEVSCLVKGYKVYDPRKDTTEGGVGSHRHTNDLTTSPVFIASSTWEYSNNPALCLAAYLMDPNLGLGEDPARIDWDSVAVAANICEEVVSVPTGASPESTTQLRYTCNIVIDPTDRYEDNIDALCTTMLGHCYYSSGKWQIYAGAWTASQFSLGDDDLVGGVNVQADIPRKDKYNSVRGQYYDALREYQPSEFQPRTDAAYVAADGETIWREIELSGCTNEYEAQRAAIIVMRRSRNRRTLVADFSMAAFGVRPFETGEITISELGWTNEPMRCTAWEFIPDGRVRLTLTEETSTDWTNPAIGEYDIASTGATPTTTGYTPPACTNLSINPARDGPFLAWACPDLAPGSYFEIIRETTSSLSSPVTVLTTTYGKTYLDVGTGDTTYYYWVRAVSASGVRGPIYPAGSGTSGASTGASTPTAPSGFESTGVTDGIRLNWIPGTFVPAVEFELYRESSSTPGSPMTPIGRTSGNSFVDMGTGLNTYWYWIRAMSELGKFSGFIGPVSGTADLIGTTDIDGDAVTKRYEHSITSASESGGPSSTTKYVCIYDFTPTVDCECIVRLTFLHSFSGGAGGYTIRFYPFIRTVTETGSPATLGTVTTGPRKTPTGTAQQAYACQGVFSVTGGQKYRAGLYITINTTSNPVYLEFADVDLTIEEFRR